jgi:hypothetical protein
LTLLRADTSIEAKDILDIMQIIQPTPINCPKQQLAVSGR